MTLEEQLGEWYRYLRYEFEKPYMKRLSSFLKEERKQHIIHPKSEDVFKAYRLTPLSKLRVLILGQDPFPHLAANGLAFSVNDSLEKVPPSLRNIFKELDDDLGFRPYHDPDLSRWAKQGVMLLNTSLTVREKQPGSHSKKFGWERFTKKTIDIVCAKEEPVIFILWGNHAQQMVTSIPKRHYRLYSTHPSPFSCYRGFFGSKPFSRTNTILNKHHNTIIDWFN